MNFLGASLTQKLNKSSTRSSAHDGIIYQNYAFPLNAGFYGTQLNAHLVKTELLLRSNKGSANIFIFHQSYSVGNTTFLTKTQGCIQARIRHAYNHISIDRMMFCKKSACTQACFIYGNIINHRIWTCKINIFKNAGTLRTIMAMFLVGSNAFICKRNYLPRFYVTNKLCSHCH